jgi:hypothetical protein
METSEVQHLRMGIKASAEYVALVSSPNSIPAVKKLRHLHPLPGSDLLNKSIQDGAEMCTEYYS